MTTVARRTWGTILGVVVREGLGRGFCTETGMKCKNCEIDLEKSIEAKETARAKVLRYKYSCLQDSQKAHVVEWSEGTGVYKRR